MPDTETIVELLAAEGAVLVPEYGSSIQSPEAANDIDLFALYEDETGQQENVRLAPFEILRVTKREVQAYREVLNPVYCTEPVLKWVVHHGDQVIFEALRSDLEARNPTEEAVQYDLRRSCAEYSNALDFLKTDDLERVGKTLAFAVSYRLFANWYADDNPPATSSHRSESGRVLTAGTRGFELLARLKESDPVEATRLEAVFLSWQHGVL